MINTIATAPKVFMGEYAAQSVAIVSPRNRNNLECALAEAAFMTGLERNADVVRMASYAPLFAHVEAWQWTPNLIWTDNLRVYGTPNLLCATALLPQTGGIKCCRFSHNAPEQSIFPAGRIGLGHGRHRGRIQRSASAAGAADFAQH